jgi:hypothetical protein
MIPVLQSDIDRFTGYETRNMIVAPVATKEKVWGVSAGTE